MAKLQLPFELQKPDASTFVTQATEIGHNGKSVSDELDALVNKAEGLDGLSVDKMNSIISILGKHFLLIELRDGYTPPSSQSTTSVCGKAVCGHAILGTN